MRTLPLTDDEFHVAKDLSSVTVHNREFADILKRELNLTLTTAAGPIDPKKVKIGLAGEVIIGSPDFAKLVEDALQPSGRPGKFNPAAADLNVGPVCGVTVNFGCGK